MLPIFILEYKHKFVNSLVSFGSIIILQLTRDILYTSEKLNILEKMLVSFKTHKQTYLMGIHYIVPKIAWMYGFQTRNPFVSRINSKLVIIV